MQLAIGPSGSTIETGHTMTKELNKSCACRGIVPPHILEQIVLRGDEEARRASLATIEADAVFRAERALVPPAQGATAGAGKDRRIYDANNGVILPGTLVRSEGQGAGADVAVNEAYEGLGATYDLMSDIFGRDSMDDAGMPLIGSVHYRNQYNNAGWNGVQMVFGDGDGVYFNRFTAAIDIMGHELAHGVTTNESDLEYSYQSGALNEHCSDVIGSLVKQYAASPKQTAADADWIIGAGLFTAAVNGVGLRSMKDPGTAYDDDVLGKDPQPGHMDDYVVTTSDYGGVHINSGIPNRAFYLAAVAFGGHAWGKAGQIWYATMTDSRLTSTAQFTDFAALTVDNAQGLYSSAEADVVREAWRQVGIHLDSGAMSGQWTLHYSWGCTGAYGQVDITFNGDGTFGGALTGQWFKSDATLLLSFNGGPAKYSGTVVGNVGNGAMTTFAGLDGCWYITKQGTVGLG